MSFFAKQKAPLRNCFADIEQELPKKLPEQSPSSVYAFATDYLIEASPAEVRPMPASLVVEGVAFLIQHIPRVDETLLCLDFNPNVNH